MKSFLLLAILWTVICVSVSASAATLYVTGSVSSSGDGTTWATALKTIQEGIDKALEGDTVIVAFGRYVENIRFSGSNILLQSTDPLNSNVVANTIIEMEASDPGSVVTFSGAEDETCMLEGFTIQKGGWSNKPGAGICGGTLEGSHAHATIRRNVITKNPGGYYGAIAFCDGLIENNLISDNWPQYGGGLAYCNGTIRNNEIRNNHAYWGGGLYECDGIIEGNTIANNYGDYTGGLYGCDGTIEGNRIISNDTNQGAGGLAFCHGLIRNNLIAGNRASGHSGGLSECRGTILNNTIVCNSAGSFGGGLAGDSVRIQNCVVWANTAPSYPQVRMYLADLPTHCCIQDWGEGGDGNIADDPRFADPDGLDNDPLTYQDNDYRLATGSPCIDAGLNEDWMWDAVDMGGNPRILPGNSTWKVDMGAYEYVSPSYELRGYVRKSDTGIQLIWTSQGGAPYAVWSCLDLLTDAWTEETTVESQGVATSWTDGQALGTLKFYRVEMQ
ncbi:MAG: right-handed parallel beta-helix repeat-containing protein [bacterium]|nr:right-handed parallel beta-helix repeat-containing protein [bacterium]